MTLNPPRPLVTAVAALTLAGLLTACGGGDSDEAGPASLDDGATASDDSDGGGGGGNDPATSQDFQDAMLEYAQCMREQGIDMPDPGTGGGGPVLVGPGPESSQAEREAFAAADEVCSPILEDVAASAPQIDPEDQAQLQDQMVAVAQCMRDRGYDMPDPEVDSQGNVQIPLGESVQPGEADFEEFQAAMRECQDEVGVAGLGSGAGPGGAGGGG